MEASFPASTWFGGTFGTAILYDAAYENEGTAIKITNMERRINGRMSRFA